MKFLTTILLLTLVTLITSTSQAADKATGWFTDIEEAIKVASESNKNILVKFTGSDWCAPCQMIQKEVFSKEEFSIAVKELLVLCVIDSPKKDKALATRNKPSLSKYKISEFPTALLLTANGKEFKRFNPAAFPTVKKMVAQLELQLRRKEMF